MTTPEETWAVFDRLGANSNQAIAILVEAVLHRLDESNRLSAIIASQLERLADKHGVTASVAPGYNGRSGS